MPTLNAAGVVEHCLRSVRAQDYPQNLIEIVVGDAGSRDGTRELVIKYGGQIVPDEGRHFEDGKKAALSRATGDFVVFVDADNEITHPDYIRLAVEALAARPSAFGVEAYYPPSAKMSSLCAYLTHLLHISDPVSWMMSVKPVFLGREDHVERWTFPARSMAYPLGANGFVFRAHELRKARANERFSDTHTAIRVIEATGKREWLRITGRGVHHYYVTTMAEFLKKRQRATCHFFNTKKEHGFTWTESKPRMPGWLACLCCSTFIWPLCQTIAGLMRDRDVRWLWHPAASLASVSGIAWGVLTYLRRSHDERITQSLQPRQSLDG